MDPFLKAYMENLRNGDAVVAELETHMGSVRRVAGSVVGVDRERGYVDCELYHPEAHRPLEQHFRMDTGKGRAALHMELAFSPWGQWADARLLQATAQQLFAIRCAEEEEFLERVFREKWNRANRGTGKPEPDRKELAQWAAQRYILRRPALGLSRVPLASIRPHDLIGLTRGPWLEVAHRRRPGKVLARKEWPEPGRIPWIVVDDSIA